MSGYYKLIQEMKKHQKNSDNTKRLLGQMDSMITLYSGFTAERLQRMRLIRNRLLFASTKGTEDSLAIQAAEVIVTKFLNKPDCFREEALKRVTG